MSASYIQKNLDELRKRLHDNIVIDLDDIDIIDLDDEYMYEQLEIAAEEDSEQHF